MCVKVNTIRHAYDNAYSVSKLIKKGESVMFEIIWKAIKQVIDLIKEFLASIKKEEEPTTEPEVE